MMLDRAGQERGVTIDAARMVFGEKVACVIDTVVPCTPDNVSQATPEICPGRSKER